MEFELSQWGDGTIRLYFEDRIHGNDRVYILGEDGRVYREDGDALTLVDIVQELRFLALNPIDLG